jgi:Xaa-Pro aminopeptidase
MSNLQRILTEERLDALLIGNLMNIRYLTGFTGSAGYLVVEPDGATLYVDGRYTDQATQQFAGGRAVTTPRDILGGVLKAVTEGRTASRFGFESRHLPHEQWRRVADALAGSDVVPTVDTVERLRGRKDPSEIAAIRRAVEITDRAYEDFLTWVKPGMPEYEVAARCEHFQRSQGADRKETRTAVGSGPRSSLPHCIAEERVLGTDEPVMLDVGCTVDGYTSDLTRTAFLGKPSKEFEEIYRIVGDAQAAAIQAIRPGAIGRDIHNVARDYLARFGYGDRFPHALGHSIGLNIHERPHFSAYETQAIEPGNVITVEPGVYLPGLHGVRTEDVIVVTDTGCEVLSHARRDLVIR